MILSLSVTLNLVKNSCQKKEIDVHYCFFRSWMAKVIDDDFPELNIFWHDYKWSPPNRKLFSFFENFYTRGEY